MKVLIFATTYIPFIGGAEIAVDEITKRIPDVEFDMITVNLDGKQRKFERIGNVNVYRISGPKILFPIVAFIKSFSLKKKYDLIWSIMASYAGFASLFFKFVKPKVPFLLTLQEGDSKKELKWKFRYVYFLFKMIIKKANMVQAISKYLEDFAKEFNSKTIVIPNGVDVEKFSRPKREIGDEVTLVTTSRLVMKNAVSDIIKSLEYLPENVKLVIVGDGELRSSLEKESDLSRVRFAGQLKHPELIAELQSADIFVRPSLSEGFGNSFVEAMASRLPVIATPVGGIVDFLKDKETGFFCKVNDPRDIAEKVKFIINNPVHTERVVENAYHMVLDRYSWDTISKKMKNSVFDVLFS
ncbi:MAG: glycosyltransferase family 4 protein [Candidatus Pacebacteria bacterium]|nr:glycosyltransferase family 4 protein [Candidatus Paceibacterota bacterium]